VNLDAVSLRIVWDRLIAICQDAGATMVRTAFSPVVREGNDYCCSLLDVRGRQLAEPSFTLPSFTGTLPFTVRAFLERYPIDRLRPGDALLTNDPWLGTGQLNDFNVATPIFDRRGRPMAIAACAAHTTDIGGVVSRGTTRDMHEEGVRIPISLLAREGELNRELLEIIESNVRTPDECLGDLLAMLAANRTMGERLTELVEDADIDDVGELADLIFERSETSMRRALTELPVGECQGEAALDGPDGDVHIRVRVEVGERGLEVDYSGSSPQSGACSLNVPMHYTYAFTVYPVKLLVNPRLPTNDGALRPLRVTAPSGSIVNSRYPAAGYSRAYVGHMLHAALFSAFAAIAPDRVWAHSGSAPGGTDVLLGAHADGSPLVHMFFGASGGTGAMPEKDGEVCFFPTNLRGTSIELTESVVPVLFERKELLADTAGPGRFRGGPGVRWTLRNIGSSPLVFSGQLGRLTHPAEGLLGGGRGSLNVLLVNEQPQARAWGRWTLRPGDRVTKVHAGGGGLRSPLLRDPERVAEDVREGLVSEPAAARDYGVIVSAGEPRGLSERRLSAGPDQPELLLAAAVLLDGLDDVPPLTGAALALAGGSIVAVGSREELVRRWPSVRVVDHAGCALVPGLIDCHVHLTLPGDGTAYERGAERDRTARWRLASENAARHLRAGVTTLCDLGSHGDLLEWPDRRRPDLPRTLLYGPPLTHPRGHMWRFGGGVRGPARVAARARANLEAGSDGIKLVASGGGTVGTVPHQATLTVEEMAAAVQVAHAAGRRVTAHCLAVESLRRAAVAGVDGVEHLAFLAPDGTPRFSEAVARTLIERGIPVGSTVGVNHRYIGLAERGEADPRELAEQRARTASYVEHARRFHGLGGRIVAGADAGWKHTPFGDLVSELELLAQAGLGELGALAAASAHAARAVGLGEVGRLAAGRRADVLVVEGDPSRDVGALRRVRAVYRDGRRVV
jgi:N-methylhydantoinase B